MLLQDVFVDFLARRLGVPVKAVRLFRTARAFSGLQRGNLPTELIPLNVTQIARGVLNFAVLQSLEDWVLPYWVNRQFDPDDPSFIPRSHTGVLMNTTQRNWTAVGNPDCSVEPIVDPRGMVTPLRDGWSIDSWLSVDGEEFYPSRFPEIAQSLVEGLPIVQTSSNVREVGMELTTWTDGGSLYHRLVIVNNRKTAVVCKPALAIRPFNPEGVAPIHHLSGSPETLEICVDGNVSIQFSRRPAVIHCSNRESGDAALLFTHVESSSSTLQATCPLGLANAVAVFDVRLQGREQWEVTLRCPLAAGAEKTLPAFPLPENSRKNWETLLARATKITVPDATVVAYLRSSLTTLLQFTDGDSITPGPYTYHLFWFRDAAYMLSALSKFGYHDIVGKIIRSFEQHQQPSGYYRSQQGEWDSNGQALWSIWEHVMLSKDLTIVQTLHASMQRAIAWIDHTRHRAGREKSPGVVSGLLPPGLSAEHLGLTDVYFWDNFWALAGIIAHARLSTIAGKKREAEVSENIAAAYKQDILAALDPVVSRIGVIPAGPLRSWDHGAIGSCCAFSPLELFVRSDQKVKKTLDALVRTFSHHGLFFQHFIHSGINPYLSLQIGHGYLYIGDRKEFLRILKSVLALGSPTRCYPEAIHPGTGGGSMGDGHHGWVAAEILTALRNSFVFEVWGDIGSPHRLVILGGIDPAWFAGEAQFSIADAPVPEGTLHINVEPLPTSVEITLRLEPAEGISPGIWELHLPFPCAGANVAGEPAHITIDENGESIIEIRGKVGRTCLTVQRLRKTHDSL